MTKKRQNKATFRQVTRKSDEEKKSDKKKESAGLSTNALLKLH
ncbi:hypothetical protein N646_2818 [Vibrio alginolyticus NBRC 15630 = ATCC 17749]|uniref:Uncharacterized protein n=1 Tax=Vibrio alginolyticus (strain ATCC 17749 / DSM 2171 / NBRC 15630 / NCIMB 1903 / NCTC 12160 / XII-53) TaxID=1219076 RepID=A0A2I3CFC1_VIBAX|nr:hypothetical protein N646_2818 [Vibrio alginolyticus NBRC 15630 = ATCC 17749]